MTHLMGQRKLAVQRAGIVQQHIRMHGRTGGIGAAALALILVDVNPTVIKALFQDGAIILSQRSQGLIHCLLCLLIGNVLVHIRQQRGVNVVEVQLLHTQQLFAKPDIAVHTGKLFMNRFNEVIIDGHRHIGAVQRRFQRGIVFSGIGVEFQLLILPIQNGSRRVLKCGKAIVKIFIGAFPQRPVRAFFQLNEGTLGQWMGIAFGIHRVPEGQVRVRQSGVHRVRGLRHFPRGCQQLFLGGRQSMGLSPAQIGQIAAVTLQLRALGVELVQGFLGKRHDFRRVKAAGGAQLHHGAHKPALHSLGSGISGVLIRLAHTVVSQALCLNAEFLRRVQILIQCLRAGSKPASERSQIRPVLRQRFQFSFPVRFRRIQIPQRPLILLGNFLPGGDFLHCFHSCPSIIFFCRIIPHPQKNATPLAFFDILC